MANSKKTNSNTVSIFCSAIKAIPMEKTLNAYEFGLRGGCVPTTALVS